MEITSPPFTITIPFFNSPFLGKVFGDIKWNGIIKFHSNNQAWESKCWCCLRYLSNHLLANDTKYLPCQSHSCLKHRYLIQYCRIVRCLWTSQINTLVRRGVWSPLYFWFPPFLTKIFYAVKPYIFEKSLGTCLRNSERGLNPWKNLDTPLFSSDYTWSIQPLRFKNKLIWRGVCPHLSFNSPFGYSP